MVLLGRGGYALHYMNVANGSCGSLEMDRAETIRVRTAESRRAADVLGATYHEPLVDDIQIYYTPELVARMCAIVREVNPRILLLQSPQDYMEDHMTSSRLAVTAAFCRGMPNFPTDPPTEAAQSEVALYHGLPHGLADQLCRPLAPDFYVDVSGVLDTKREALSCHQSQKQWLDKSQGLDSYLQAMEDIAAEVGRMSGQFTHAEGWRRHLHLGFASRDFDPLVDALGQRVTEKT